MEGQRLLPSIFCKVGVYSVILFNINSVKVDSLPSWSTKIDVAGFVIETKMTTFTLYSTILFSQKSCVWMLAPVRLLPPPPTPTDPPSPSPKINKIWRPPLCWKDSVGGRGEGKEGHMRNTYMIFKYCSSLPPSPRPQGDGQGCWFENLQGGRGWRGWRGFRRIVISIRMYIVRYLLLDATMKRSETKRSLSI